MTQPDPWKVDRMQYPRTGPMMDRLRFIVNYAILAPSSHNTQPWRFDVADNCIDLFMDESRWLKVADDDQRELHISVGCALENLLIAGEHFGLSSQATHLPVAAKSMHAARVRFWVSSPPARNLSPALFDMLAVRHTNHGEYEARPVSPMVLDALRACATDEDIRLHLTSDAVTKRTVDELVVQSDAIEFADPEFREELAYWIGQGVFGTSWLMSKIGKLAVSYVNIGPSQAKKDSTVLMSAPLLGVITSRNDRTSQIKVGQLYQRLGLVAASFGIWCQPMSQVLQVDETKEQLAKLVPERGLIPQHLFRMGHAEPEKQHTPRRSAAEVLV